MLRCDNMRTIMQLCFTIWHHPRKLGTFHVRRAVVSGEFDLDTIGLATRFDSNLMAHNLLAQLPLFEDARSTEY